MSSIATSFLSDGWAARLDLGFLRDGPGTRLVRRGQHGPLAVQRPFFPEGPEVCHVYLLHPPGGLVPGDALTVVAHAGDDARALITAPAATKIYRSDGRTARQDIRLTVGARASLEWMPPETIVFDGARAALSTRIDLDATAAFAGWDILCFGRPACGEGFGAGTCAQGIELWRDGKPLLVERARYEGAAMTGTFGLGGMPVLGTFVACGPSLDGEMSAAVLSAARSVVPLAGTLLGATVCDGCLVARALGPTVEGVRHGIESIWRLVRPHVLGRPAIPPRIWST